MALLRNQQSFLRRLLQTTSWRGASKDAKKDAKKEAGKKDGEDPCKDPPPAKVEAKEKQEKEQPKIKRPTICEPGKKCSSIAKKLDTKKSVCLKEPCKKPVCDEGVCVPTVVSATSLSRLVPPPGPDDARVVIVGAGMAGLSAANRLLTQGVHNVTILEASHRAGGRIQSQWFGDSVVEIGGTPGPGCLSCADTFWSNPVVRRADAEGMIRHPVRLAPLATSLLTECDGRPLPLPVSLLALSKVKRILAVGEGLKATAGLHELGKCIEYVGVRIQQEVRRFPPEMKAAAARVMAALVVLATDKPFTVNDSLGTYVRLPATGINVPLGCSALINPLLTAAAHTVRYNSEVQNIRWGAVEGGGGVARAVVRLRDGSSVPADYVIFTASLGVLKAGAYQLFCPSLPGFKAQALEEASFSHKNKIFFRYKHPAWSWRECRMDRDFTEEEMCSDEGWLKGLRSIRELSDTVIQVNLEGDAAFYSERVPDTSLVCDLTRFLSGLVGGSVPMPIGVLRSQWSSNCLYRGASAAASNQALSATVPTPTDPYPPVLFFAGDGTSDTAPGTVRGAYLSGIREADKILDIMSRISCPATDPCLQLQTAL